MLKKATGTTTLKAAVGMAVVALALVASGCVPLVIGGIGAAAYVATDRRTNDTIASDERIERTIHWRLKRELADGGRVNANVYNRIVLLSGETTNSTLKQEAARAASLIDGVRGVHNEIDVMALRRAGDQLSDGATTTQVKTRMVGNGVFNPLHVQISTDGGVVFLQGLVTKAEADEASKIAASTSGVRKVVRVFEIMPDTPTVAPIVDTPRK